MEIRELIKLLEQHYVDSNVLIPTGRFTGDVEELTTEIEIEKFDDSHIFLKPKEEEAVG